MSKLKKVGANYIIQCAIILILSFGEAISQETFTITAAGATEVSVYSGASVRFSTDLNMNTITADSFFVTDSSGNRLPILDRYVANSNSLSS